MLRVVLPVNPVPASRPRVTKRGWTYYPKVYRQFREVAGGRALEAVELAGIYEPLEGPIGIDVTFRVRRPKTTKLDYPKPDYDNYLKSLDVLNGLLWVDDCDIVVARCQKVWAAPGEDGCIELDVWPEVTP